MNGVKKITRATFKSFVRKNVGALWVKIKGDFDGMVDCVMPTQNAMFKPSETTDIDPRTTLGILGVWLVGDSRDYFKPYEDDNYRGIYVSNCCGSFIVAVAK